MDAPAVAVTSDGKKIAAAWMDTRSGGNNRDVQWTLGTGGKFTPETTVHDETRGTQGHPSLVFDSEGTAWCCWEDARADANRPRIYAANSKTRKNFPVSEEPEGKCGYPTLAAGGGLVAVIYESGSGVSFRILAGE
jgi:hypothetical protein